jgi:hypothetical protein
MRFAHKHYYIERYTKCDCCGVLIYGAGVPSAAPSGAPRLFCSDWCRAWTALRDKGAEPRLPLQRESSS